VCAERPDADIVPLARLPMDAVLRYDADFFPDNRASFLRHWVRQRGSTALGLVRGGRLAGFGVVRPCRAGCKIGPLFADDAALADRLLRALAAELPLGTRVQLDIPAVNPGAVALVAAHGLAPVFQTARMYTGAAPALPLGRIFGVSTFELG